MAALPTTAEELLQIVKDDFDSLDNGIPLKYSKKLENDIHKFLIRCILEEPYRISNKLLSEALELFKSKGITGEQIDSSPVLPSESQKNSNQYYFRHSLLFVSLGQDNEQSTLLKNFGCSLNYDIQFIQNLQPPLTPAQEDHKTTLNTVKILHYNRTFSEEPLPTVSGGKSKRRKLKRRKSRKY